MYQKENLNNYKILKKRKGEIEIEIEWSAMV